MAKVQDSATVDARNRDTAKRQPDASPSDGSVHFDGVLSDVKADTQNAKAPDAPAAKPEAAPAGKSASTDETVSPGKTIPTKAPTPGTDPAGASSGNVVPMAALLELLGKGSATKTATDVTVPVKGETKDAGKESGASKGNGTDGASVDSMLQKIAAKDAAIAPDATAAPAPTTAPPPTPPSDLVSLLMLGVPAAPAAVDTSSSKASAAPARSGTATAVPGARDMPLDGTDHTLSKEVVVSDVTIETHLAPAAPGNVASLAESHKDATPQPSISDAVSAHASAVAAVTVDATSQVTGTMSAPVRSVATALVDLAARTDETPRPAAAPAEQSKPTLGVARTMTLQMNPANLGTVDIRMHKTGQTLDVQLSVSDPRTLGIVSRERDTLAKALSDQNYALNSLVIQDGGAAASSGGNNAASQGDSPGSHARSERQSAGYGADGQGSSRSQGQGAGRDAGKDQPASGDAAPRPAPPSRSGSLFV